VPDPADPADRAALRTPPSLPGTPAGVAAAVALDQSFDGHHLVALRTAVAAGAAALGLSEEKAGDLVLVAHELAANAVRHGGATPAAPGRLRLWRDGSAVYCQVSDGGPGLADPATAGTRPVPPLAGNGRGLWIVRQITERLHISSGPAGSTVTAALTASA
jgi:anti-sigma regulatory factor (Ser/Thr protein kinase)